MHSAGLGDRRSCGQGEAAARSAADDTIHADGFDEQRGDDKDGEQCINDDKRDEQERLKGRRIRGGRIGQQACNHEPRGD